MPKRNKYALIAKDNNSVNYKFISFDEEQITKLEKIDLYTMVPKLNLRIFDISNY